MKTSARDILVAEAIGAVAGAAIVLDDALRIAFATDAAEAVLGKKIVAGASAPDVLCGKGPKRPVAEALAAGRPVQALVRRPGDDQTGYVYIRSVPLKHGKSRIGWVLMLSDPGGDDTEPELFHGLWTRDPRMKHLFRVVTKVAQDDVSVLVRGETGSGKELVAAAVHAESPRKKAPFRVINCAALPASLLESELFGHARGAFTGAVKDTPGHIQLAHRGTLFLDEVAEVPLELQAKLLRVLETREVVPVGGREPIAVDVRIVSATHRALRKEVEAGRFRGDLMYRLRVIPIYIPPLRERRHDIELLVTRFIAEMNPTKRRAIEDVSAAAWLALERHDWPGNVRELKNVLAYAYAIGDGPVLEASHLPPELAPQLANPDLGPLSELAQLEARADQRPTQPLSEGERLQQALAESRGNRTRAAKSLGMSRVTLWRRLRDLGLT